MKKTLFSRVVAATSTIALLTSCTIANKVEDEIVKTTGTVKAVEDTIMTDPNRGPLRVTDKPILGTKVIRPTLGMPLPQGMDTKKLGWQFDSYVTLPDVAAKITETVNLPVRINDRRSAVSGSGGASVPAQSLVGGPDTVVTPQNVNSAFQSTLGGAGAGVQINGGGRPFGQVYLPSFEGTLPQFLQSLESRFDVQASFRDGAIILDAFQLVTCDVAAPPTTSTITAEVTGATTGAASGPSGSTSSQASQTQAKLDTFAEIRATLSKLVMPSDVFDVSPAFRRFTVVGGAETARRARAYCDQLSDFLNTRIAVEATIVEVTINEGDDYGLNLDPVWKGAGLNLHLAGVAPQIANTAGSGSITVLAPSDGGASAHWGSSQAFIKAASTAGRLAQSRRAVAILQNGRSQTLNLTTRQDYVKNITTVPGNANTGTSSGTQTDTINYGYSMQITAHATGADELQIHGSLTVSDLAAQIDKATGNNNVVQLLTVPQRSFDIDIPLANNETIVVSGNENVRARRDQSGIINPSFFLAGGADKAAFETTRIVLFLTAYRLTNPHQNKAPTVP